MSVPPVDRKTYGIYVHIPFCRSKCKYCAFVSTPDASLQKRYVSALLSEISRSTHRGAAVDTVYIGGGTPSCLFDGGISKTVSAIRDAFDVSASAEITVECNPESVSELFIDECVKSGVNRVSMGLQSACDGVLRAVGRVHTYNDYVSAVKLLATAFDNISSDIILGLPQQSFDDVDKAVDTISEYCKHASVYALSVESGTPLFAQGYKADDDLVADMYDRACSRLFDNGFMRYEVSNFARDGNVSAHNVKYWRCAPYLGFGVASHGYDGVGTRYAHGDDILGYIADQTPESYALSPKDKYNEYIMLALRTVDGIDLSDYEKRFGASFIAENESVLRDLTDGGYVVATDERVKIADRYLFVMNGIIERLMKD